MAQIVGTGVDIIEVERVERALTRPLTGARFRSRVFTEREIAYCESRGRPRYQSYAARFAAKEATMKAMGTGWNRDVGWREIEVVRERGPPQYREIPHKSKPYRVHCDRACYSGGLTRTHNNSLSVSFPIPLPVQGEG
jgi:holo-[acyl-carrier protein] synthase